MSQERYEHYADFICENYYGDKSQAEKDLIKEDLLSYFEDGDQDRTFKKLPKLRGYYGYSGPENLAKELKKEKDIDVKKRVSFLIIAYNIHDFFQVFLVKEYDVDKNEYEEFKELSKEWNIPIKYFMVLYLEGAGINSSAKFLKNLAAIKYWNHYSKALEDDFEANIGTLDIISTAFASFSLPVLYKNLPEQMLPKVIEYSGLSAKTALDISQGILKDYTGDISKLFPMLKLKRAKSREFAVELFSEKWISNELVKEELLNHYKLEKNKNVLALMETIFIKENWPIPEVKGKKTAKKVKKVDLNSSSSPFDYFLNKSKKYIPKDNGKEPVKKALAAYNITKKPLLKWTNGEEAPIQISYYLLVLVEKSAGNLDSPEIKEILPYFDKKQLALWISELFKEWEISTKGAWFISLVKQYGDKQCAKTFSNHVISFYYKTGGRRYDALDTLMAVVPYSEDDSFEYLQECAKLLYKGAEFHGHAVKILGDFPRIQDKLIRKVKDLSSFLKINKDLAIDQLHDTKLFDKDGFYTKKLDYGSRIFSLKVNEAGKLVIFDEKGKELKRMPTKAKKDDLEKVKKAKDEYKLIELAIKNEITFAKRQILAKLESFYTLTLSLWKEIYLDNPLLNPIAKTLIWGVYYSKKLVSSFRIMDDNSFTDVNDEEFILNNKVEISLLHPSDISEDDINKWKEQFNDYEISPFINQLDRVLIDTENLDWTKEFQGWMVKNQNHIFFEKGYQFGQLSDGGGIYDLGKDLGNGYMEIQFHNCLNWSYNGNIAMIPIYDIYFKNPPKNQRLMSAVYYELKDFCLSSGYNENWKDITEW